MKYIISIIAILGLFINSVFAGGHKKIKVGMITTLSEEVQVLELTLEMVFY